MTWTLVTGGAKGLGAAICQTLAKEGYPILVHYRSSKQEAEKVVAACQEYGVEAYSIQGDFSSMESTMQFVSQCQQRYPVIHHLINNVGNDFIRSGTETTPTEWHDLFQTNVHAPFILSHAFIPSLKTCQGSILNIGVVGINQIHASVKRTAYMATKYSLLVLTKSLAKELAPFHVRVNMVSPGYLENSVDLPLSKIPMQRAATLEECTRVVSFLLRNENAYLTGQNIEVGGGVGV